MQKRNSSPPRKPWPMHWTILAIAGFIILYTFVTLRFRKEEPAHLPYESLHQRSGHELQAAGWKPFPNAYGISGDGAEFENFKDRLKTKSSPRIIKFDSLPRDHPSVTAWSADLPPLEQGEQIRQIEAPETIAKGDPYFARISWIAPDGFKLPQMIVFKKDNQILIVPRAPEKLDSGSREESIFIIPPDQIDPGKYEILLSTDGFVNRWTFLAEPD